MSILQEHIAMMKKEELLSHQSQLTTFFLEALDFRSQHSEVSWTPPHIPELSSTCVKAKEEPGCNSCA
jgi:hypothetical protein